MNLPRFVFLFASLALIVTLGLVGCSGDDDVTVSNALTDKLVETEWVLVSYGKIGSEVAAMPGRDEDAFVHFSTKGYFSGYGGCNYFFCDYYQAYEDGRIETKSGITITAAYCEQPKGLYKQEEVFYSALSDLDSYELSNDSLKLYYDSRQSVLILSKRLEFSTYPH